MRNSAEHLPYFQALADQLLASDAFGPASETTKARMILKLMCGFEHDIDPLRSLSEMKIVFRKGKLTMNGVDGHVLEDGEFECVEQTQFAISFHLLLEIIESSERYSLQVVCANAEEAEVCLFESGNLKWTQKFGVEDADRLGWTGTELYMERSTEINLAEAVVSTLDLHGIWVYPVYIRLVSTTRGRLRVSDQLLKSVGSFDFIVGDGFEAAVIYEDI